MHTETTSTSPPTLAARVAREAAAAQHAITTESKKENARQIAELSGCADQARQAEHIRGMVATTLAHLSIDASASTRENAEHWQQWALGIATAITGRPAGARHPPSPGASPDCPETALHPVAPVHGRTRSRAAAP